MKFTQLYTLYISMSEITANKVLTIRRSDGISQTIARELKSELHVNEMNLGSVWNEIFNVVKNDHPTQSTQYRGGDQDINNKNNYVVDEGQYVLSESAWEKICNAAKKKLGITSQTKTTTPNETSQNTNAPKTSSYQEQIKTVEQYFSDSDFDFASKDDEFKKEVLATYNVIVSVAKQNNQEIDETSIKTRLVNYAKALNFHKAELAAKKGTDVVYENSDCANAKNTNELIDKYKQFGKEYVELYDKNGDKSIDVYELFYKDLSDNLVEQYGYDKTKAEKAAITITQEYKKNGYTILNQPKEDSIPAEIFRDAVNKITIIDTAKGATVNGNISTDEAAAHLITMAQICDNKNSITKSEFTGTELAIRFQDCNIAQIKEELNCSDEFAKKVYNYVSTYKERLDEYMPYFNK